MNPSGETSLAVKANSPNLRLILSVLVVALVVGCLPPGPITTSAGPVLNEDVRSWGQRLRLAESSLAALGLAAGDLLERDVLSEDDARVVRDLLVRTEPLVASAGAILAGIEHGDEGSPEEIMRIIETLLVEILGILQPEEPA